MPVEPTPAAALALSGSDRATLEALAELAGPTGEVTAPTAVLADRLGGSPRTAQLRLKRLVGLGLVTRVRDYRQPGRHRITLRWGPAVPAPPPARVEAPPVWDEAAAAARLTELGRALRRARSEVARLTERLRRQDEELRRLRGAPPEAP